MHGKTLILALCLALCAPRAAAGQQLLTGALGGAVGLAAGGYISVALIVADARQGDYIHSIRDVLGWKSVPVVVGAASGAVLGGLDSDRLLRTTWAGAGGTAAGAAIGLAIGSAVWEGSEGKWSGAAIGAGAGMIVGALVGLLLPPGDDDADPAGPAPAAPLVTVRIPLGR